MTTSDESERRVLPPRSPVDPWRVFEDDLTVEAARTGRLDDEDPDPLAQLLGRLRTCASGTCPCDAHERCAMRALGPNQVR